MDHCNVVWLVLGYVRVGLVVENGNIKLQKQTNPFLSKAINHNHFYRDIEIPYLPTQTLLDPFVVVNTLYYFCATLTGIVHKTIYLFRDK